MRTAIFVDGPNFFTSMQNFEPGLRLDYDVLANWLIHYESIGQTTLVGAYYYIGVDENQSEQAKKFLMGLDSRVGYFVRRGRRVRRSVTCRHCAKSSEIVIEKFVDVRLSVDCLQLVARRACDRIILLSGDEDYLPLIEAVNAYGVQTWIAAWGRELSANLMRAAYGTIDLKQGVNVFRMKSNNEGENP